MHRPRDPANVAMSMSTTIFLRRFLVSSCLLLFLRLEKCRGDWSMKLAAWIECWRFAPLLSLCVLVLLGALKSVFVAAAKSQDHGLSLSLPPNGPEFLGSDAVRRRSVNWELLTTYACWFPLRRRTSRLRGIMDHQDQ
jgi:hypothetical protein